MEKYIWNIESTTKIRISSLKKLVIVKYGGYGGVFVVKGTTNSDAYTIYNGKTKEECVAFINKLTAE